MNSFASAQHTPNTSVALPFSRTCHRPPSVDDIYPQIFDAILDQRFAPTRRFSEERLIERLGISRSVVRQVLARLSHQQILILRPNHQPQIAVPDLEHSRQILHARRLTETTLVRLACQQPRPEELKRLRGLIERQRQCAERNQRGPSIRLSGEFHLQLAEMAGNAPLAHFLGSLVPLTSLALAQRDAQASFYCAWQQQAAMVDALERQDAAMAVTLISRHLDHLAEILLSPEPVAARNRIVG